MDYSANVSMLGRSMILVAAGFAVYSAILGLARWRDPAAVESSRRAAAGSFVALGVSLLLLWIAFFRRDFSLAYVAGHTTTATAGLYTFTGLWSGMEGSLLLYSAMLAGYGWMFAARSARSSGPQTRTALAVVELTAAFFIVMTGLAANPFARADVVAPEGRGMNPLLYSPGMAFHPLLLYLGFTGTAVVFGLAVSGLVHGVPWVSAARRWTLFAWLTLGLGLVVGGAWAYTELGWGGLWGWDPVENAALAPWLALTALLHSVQAEERRGVLRTWNAALASIAFLLAVLGTFLTRSGALYSIHSFAQSPVGWWFFVFVAVGTIGSLTLVGWRSSRTSPPRLDGPVSREVVFLLNNLLLLTVVVALLVGSDVVPALTQALGGRRIVMGAPFFNVVANPLLAALVLLSVVGVALPWGRPRPSRRTVARVGLAALPAAAVTVLATAIGARGAWALSTLWLGTFGTAFHALALASDWRAYARARSASRMGSVAGLVRANPRRYGSYLVHAGMAVVLLGFAGSFWKTQTDVTLRPGGSTRFSGFTLTSLGLEERSLADRDVIRAPLRVRTGAGRARFLAPQVQLHPNWESQPRARMGILPTVRGDLYVVLRSWDPSGETSYSLHWNPLQWLVWAGVAVAFLGGLTCLTPARGRARRPVSPAPQLAERT